MHIGKLLICTLKTIEENMKLPMFIEEKKKIKKIYYNVKYNKYSCVLYYI